MSSGIVPGILVIVIQYTPNSKKKFVKVTSVGYDEVTDPSKATTFEKKKYATTWIKNNIRHPQYTSVEDVKYYLNSLKGA